MTMIISGDGLIEGLHQVDTKSVVLAGSSIDLSLGNYFSKTISSNTTFSVTNVPADNKAVSFTLEVNGGSAYTINWWNDVKWEEQRPPVFSTYRDIFKFYTNDGGDTWYGSVVSSNAKTELNSHWISLIGGASDDRGYGIAVDSSGNVYTTGYTDSQGAGNYDVLITKYDTSGTLLWQRILGGASGDFGYGIAVDSSGNVYIAGGIVSQGAGGDDVLIAKYDTSGTLQWQRTLGGASSDYGLGIAVDSSGNVYVTGGTNSQGAGGYDVLIAKYNTSGTLQWQRALGGSGDDEGWGTAVDSSGNVYVTGWTESEGAGNEDAFIVKYDTSGTLQWQRVLGGASNDRGYNVAVDSSGNVYITGYTDSQGAGNDDVLIAKYNTSGTLQWQRTLGGASGDVGNGIAVDSSGNVYVTGRTLSQGAGNFDVLIAKYNTSGTLQWQRTLGGASSDYGQGIAVDSSGNVYVNGQTTSQGAGGWDVLIVKLPADGSGIGSYFANTIQYIQSNLTSATSTLTSATSTLTSATSTLTDQSATLTSQTSTLTSTTTVV